MPTHDTHLGQLPGAHIRVEKVVRGPGAVATETPAQIPGAHAGEEVEPHLSSCFRELEGKIGNFSKKTRVGKE